MYFDVLHFENKISLKETNTNQGKKQTNKKHHHNNNQNRTSKLKQSFKKIIQTSMLILLSVTECSSLCPIL